jgi:hypothetical protein
VVAIDKPAFDTQYSLRKGEAATAFDDVIVMTLG